MDTISKLPIHFQARQTWTNPQKVSIIYHNLFDNNQYSDNFEKAVFSGDGQLVTITYQFHNGELKMQYKNKENLVEILGFKSNEIVFSENIMDDSLSKIDLKCVPTVLYNQMKDKWDPISNITLNECKGGAYCTSPIEIGKSDKGPLNTGGSLGTGSMYIGPNHPIFKGSYIDEDWSADFDSSGYIPKNSIPTGARFDPIVPENICPPPKIIRKQNPDDFPGSFGGSLGSKQFNFRE